MENKQKYDTVIQKYESPNIVQDTLTEHYKQNTVISTATSPMSWNKRRIPTNVSSNSQSKKKPEESINNNNDKELYKDQLIKEKQHKEKEHKEKEHKEEIKEKSKYK